MKGTRKQQQQQQQNKTKTEKRKGVTQLLVKGSELIDFVVHLS